MATKVKKLYTVSETADVLDVSRQTIYNWMVAGRFPDAFEVGWVGSAITLIPVPNVEAVRAEETQKLLDKLARLGYQTVTEQTE